MGYDRLLIGCKTEMEVSDKLHEIFDVKWKNHIQYNETPAHFYLYLDYLHMAMAKNPLIEIEGLDPDPEFPGETPTRFESPYIHEKKLKLIANPEVIRRLKKTYRNSGIEGCLEECKDIYGRLNLKMSDRAWKALVEESLVTSKPRNDKAIVRYIKITFPGGESEVFQGNAAFEKVVGIIGVGPLRNSAVRHRGQKILTTTFPQKYKLYFKSFCDGYFINLLGSPLEKYKTLLVLNSIFRLGLGIELVNECQSQPKTARKRGRPRSAHTESASPAPRRGRGRPRKEAAITKVQETGDSSLNYGFDGTLNLFDE